MAWSTSVIAPPDGSMRDYIASLEKVARRSEAIYWPGHGGPVRDPQRYVRALISHRRQREAAILARLEAGEASVAEIVARVYPGLAPALVGAASLSTLAHLEDLTARGLAVERRTRSRSKRGFAAPDVAARLTAPAARPAPRRRSGRSGARWRRNRAGRRATPSAGRCASGWRAGGRGSRCRRRSRTPASGRSPRSARRRRRAGSADWNRRSCQPRSFATRSASW